MIREILFRGKKETITRENKKYTDGWVCGDTLYKDDNGVYLIPMGVSAESYHLGKYDFRANSDRFEIMVAKINPETLGQYIGRTDKNGRKIFEGDILEFDFDDIGKQMAVVYYNEKYHSFLLNVITSNFQFTDIGDGVIVGNIHDNPELIIIKKKRKGK